MIEIEIVKQDFLDIKNDIYEQKELLRYIDNQLLTAPDKNGKNIEAIWLLLESITEVLLNQRKYEVTKSDDNVIKVEFTGE